MKKFPRKSSPGSGSVCLLEGFDAESQKAVIPRIAHNWFVQSSLAIRCGLFTFPTFPLRHGGYDMPAKWDGECHLMAARYQF